MNLIITMAGKYIRFRKAGYNQPKFLLPLIGHNSVFREVLEQLVAGYDFENIIFVANKADFEYKSAIEKVIMDSRVINYDLLFIGDTKGQAETALEAVKVLEQKGCKSQKILIHNIDTVLYGRDMSQIRKLLDQHDGCIDVFEAHEQGYSFVKTSENHLVTEIREKEVISNKATTGLYAFADMQQYRTYYQRLKTNREYYISFIYDLMLNDGKEIAVNSQYSKTLIVGTPAEYELYKTELNH